jgi:transposase-like protein
MKFPPCYIPELLPTMLTPPPAPPVVPPAPEPINFSLVRKLSLGKAYTVPDDVRAQLSAYADPKCQLCSSGGISGYRVRGHQACVCPCVRRTYGESTAAPASSDPVEALAS